MSSHEIFVKTIWHVIKEIYNELMIYINIDLIKKNKKKKDWKIISMEIKIITFRYIYSHNYYKNDNHIFFIENLYIYIKITYFI